MVVYAGMTMENHAGDKKRVQAPLAAALGAPGCQDPH